MKTTRERKPEKAKAAAGRAPSKWQRMSRKQRRELTRKIQADDVSLEVVHPDAADRHRQRVPLPGSAIEAGFGTTGAAIRVRDR